MFDLRIRLVNDQEPSPTQIWHSFNGFCNSNLDLNV